MGNRFICEFSLAGFIYHFYITIVATAMD